MMDLHFTGLIIGVATFLIIGIVCIIGALFIESTIISAVVGVFGASALWGIGELFTQKKRVERGWFPMNPKRAHEYKKQ